ncbi:hypothetical protein [Clostridium peptidivorans]|uniref:hypothetical protein n=1 Tax=Clostridium peptidivorans TaxID=100174 RepID=UPI000BE3DDD9|nr:hypothetical protein [Clostridium peptidivorans]
MALECSNQVPVENCQLCAQIDIEQTIVLNSGILITVTATVENVCVGSTLSVGAILCEKFDTDNDGDFDICRAIATQVTEEVVTAGRDVVCTNVTRTFTFLIADHCRANNRPREFTAAVEAHYVIDCDCPCENCPNEDI